MLRVTPEAGLVIASITARRGAYADGGLRIQTRGRHDGSPNFAISVAEVPEQYDQVLTEKTSGARVIIDPVTAEQVADQILDVDVTVDSAARFRLVPRINGS